MAGISRTERERRQALLEQGLKECTNGCGALPIERFHKRPDGFARLRGECIDCTHAAGAEYRSGHREQELGRVQLHWTQSPMGQRIDSGAVRARKLGVPVESFTAEDLRADWERRGIDPDRDVYTGEPLRDGWHLDHAVPLSTPGTPGHVVSNLVPASSTTNTSKSRRHWVDYLADRSQKEIAA